MLSALFSIRSMLFGAAVAFAAGSWAGHEVTKWYYQASTLSARNKVLEENLKRIRVALSKDEKAAQLDLANQEELIRHVDEMVARARTDSAALSPDAVERVRALFDLSE